MTYKYPNAVLIILCNAVRRVNRDFIAFADYSGDWFAARLLYANPT